MTRRLLPTGWRPMAAVCWLTCLVVLAVLSWHLHATGSATRIDLGVDGRLKDQLRGQRPLLSALVQFGTPQGVLLGAVVLAAVTAAARWWRGALLAVAAAPLAGAFTELLLKPAVGLREKTGLGFPSGHTTGAVAVALTAAVLLLPGRAMHPFPAILRVLLALAALTLALGTGVAMVALGHHRATDVVGGVATAVVVVLAVAAALDATAKGRHA